MKGTDIFQQLSSILHMITFGIIIMSGFAFTDEIKKQAKWNRYKCVVSDFILVFLYGIIFCVLLICKYYGLLRNYILLGVVIGLALYYIFLQNICQKICKYVAKSVLWCCKKIKWFLRIPWYLGSRYFLQPIKQKTIAVCQCRKKTAQSDDELEEII